MSHTRKRFGSTLDDLLFGGDGNDTHVGDYSFSGIYYDTLSGGFGADTFVLGDFSYGVAYLKSGYAVITDFDRYEGDKFQVSGTTDYSLSYSDFEVGTSDFDTGILYNTELITIVQNTTNLGDPTDFIAV